MNPDQTFTRRHSPAATIALLFAVALPIVVSGCRSHNSRDDAQVRLINALPTEEPISLAINGKTVNKSRFGDDTKYAGLKAGRYEYRLSDKSGVLGSGDAEVGKGTRYQLVAAPGVHGGPANATLVPVDMIAPEGKAVVTFVQAAECGSTVDLLFNNVVAFPDAALGGKTMSLAIPAGVYDLKANIAGDPNRVLTQIPFSAASGRTYLIVLMGRLHATPIDLKVYGDK